MIFAAFLALGLSAASCRGEDVRPAGELPLSLSLWTEGGRASDTANVRVSANTISEHGALGIVIIHPPEGLLLLAGDTTFSVPVRRVMPARVLKLRALRAGTYELLATLVVGDADNNDLLEARLLLTVGADSVSSGTSELVRTETMLDGHRYRYGGFWLVPLEADEDYSAAEFARTGIKPRQSEPVIAYCADCPTAADTVAFVAVINRSGKVIQARPLAKAAQADPATRAAAEALAKARFRPAQYRNKVITDWVQVRIPVLRTR